MSTVDTKLDVDYLTSRVTDLNSQLLTLTARLNKIDGGPWSASVPVEPIQTLKYRLDSVQSELALLKIETNQHRERLEQTVQTVLGILAEPASYENLEKVTNIVKDRFRDIVNDEDQLAKAKIYSTMHRLVEAFFKDPDKAAMWFNTNNPMLGGISPNHMILVGRHEKLLRFITTSLEENKAPGE